MRFYAGRGIRSVNAGKLVELHDRAKRGIAKYPRQRFAYASLAADSGRHFLGIAGPRGAGKTILLRQFAAAHDDAFYLSADVLEPDDDVVSLIAGLRDTLKFRTFLLDEVHFLKDPSAVLKRLYDFLDVRVIFTSSVSLAMHASAHDLSRRVRVLPLRPFSFREYLCFVGGPELPRLEIASLATGRGTPEHLRAGHRFRSYLTGGLLPFALDEPSPLPILGSILETVIQKDIPSVLRLAVDELDVIRRLVRFVGRSSVDGINYSSLSRNLGITKYKAQQYVHALAQAFVLQHVFPAGTNVLREPKVLMAPPCRLLYRDYDDAVGGLREDFAVEAFCQAGAEIQYLKSTRGAKTPDYLVDTGTEKFVIEVGGKGKGRQQFKGIQAGRKLVFADTAMPAGDRLPLFLLGFLA
jgi:predicted AAA+ superfamily ATPase